MQIKLDYPREYLTSISGHFSTSHDPEVIQSIKIQSNVKEYGRYGSEVGREFELPKTYSTKIIGFHGHFGASLHSIGAYSRSVSDNFPFKKVGPFGAQDGEEWDDGTYTGIRQIDVVSDTVIESISIWYDDHGIPTGESKRGESARGKVHSVSHHLSSFKYILHIGPFNSGMQLKILVFKVEQITLISIV